MNEINTPATLGKGIIANNMDGGHIAYVQGNPFPRWIVTKERSGLNGKEAGIAIDLSRGAICRWYLIDNENPLVGESVCRKELKTHTLIILNGTYLKGGALDDEKLSCFLDPIVDQITLWWDNRDGCYEENTETAGLNHQQYNPLVIDKRALDVLGALHGGARVKEKKNLNCKRKHALP